MAVEAIQSVVTQAAIQGVTAAGMVMKEADVGPISDTNTASLREANKAWGSSFETAIIQLECSK